MTATTTPPPAGARDLQSLKALALATDCARWETEGFEQIVGTGEFYGGLIMHENGHTIIAQQVMSPHAEFIAAANPAAILDLIARLAAAAPQSVSVPEAVSVLRSIIQDGFLSDTNTARGHRVLDVAPLPQPQTDARQELMINGRQLRDALEAAWPDRDDAEQGDTELTLFVRKQDDVSDEGEAMPRGLWFYWTDYPEEGVCQLDADAPEPAGPILKRMVERSMPSDGGASALDDLPHQGEESIDSEEFWRLLNERDEGAMDDAHAIELEQAIVKHVDAYISARLAQEIKWRDGTIVDLSSKLSVVEDRLACTAAPSEPDVVDAAHRLLDNYSVANRQNGEPAHLLARIAELYSWYNDIVQSGAPAPSESQAIPTDLSKRLFEAWATKEGTYDLRPAKVKVLSVGGVPYDGYVRPYLQDRTVHTYRGFCAALAKKGGT